MKKYLVMLLLIFPYFLFSQTKEDVYAAIDKINLELAKTYFQDRDEKLPDDIKSSDELDDYLRTFYKNNTENPLLNALKNLNFCRRGKSSYHPYKEGKDVNDYFDLLIYDYVKFKYNHDAIQKIIDDIPSKKAKTISDSYQRDDNIQEILEQKADDTSSDFGEDTINVVEIENHRYDSLEEIIESNEISYDSLSEDYAIIDDEIQDLKGDYLKDNRLKEVPVREDNNLPNGFKKLKKDIVNNEDIDEKPKAPGKNRSNTLLHILIGFMAGYFLRPIIINALKKKGQMKDLQQTSNNNEPEKVVQSLGSKKQNITKESVITDAPKTSTTNDSKSVTNLNLTKNNWIIAHASEIGRSHKIANPPIPCQDNHAIKKLAKGWGVAILCDGAGSAKLSHEGSKFISDEALKLFEAIVQENEWIKKSTLPSGKDWELLANKALKKLRYDLEQLAKFRKVDVRDLACTIIVVIYSPMGILTTHIGDGRAGYRDNNNIWKPLITPHNGEEANQTIFITSRPWLQKGFTMSGVKVPEYRVITDPPTAFTVISDGCETHSFELGYFDKDQQKFIKENKPYPKFFEPLTEALKGMHQEGLSQNEINDKWSSFVGQGTEKFKNEPDDKTLILGVITD